MAKGAHQGRGIGLDELKIKRDGYWIDRVNVIDLYKEGVHLATIHPAQARAVIFDAIGSEVASFTVLWSECPYSAVEKHLQMGRINDVIDASEEGNGAIDHSLRAISERNALAFRHSYSPAEEVDHYLERALAFARLLNVGDAPGRLALERAISTVRRDLSDGHFSGAMGTLAPLVQAMDQDVLFGWQGAWVDCVRALEALRRLVQQGSGT